MTVFSTWLVDKMIHEGYGHSAASLDKRRFSRDLGVVETTVANWIDGKNLPTMRAVVLLAKLFGLSTEDVLAAAGYEIVPSRSPTHRDERSDATLASLPTSKRFLEMIATKPPHEQDVWLSVFERLMRGDPPPINED
jgi:DNA-binding XRE family transcriptional regulator